MLGEQVFLYRRDERDYVIPPDTYPDIEVIDLSRDPSARGLADGFTDGHESLYPVLRIGGDRIVATVFCPTQDLLRQLMGDRPAPDLQQSLPKPKVYHAGQCLGCDHIEAWLNRHGIDYEKINIGLDTPTGDKIAKWSGGRRVVPTIEFPGMARLFDPPLDLLARLVGR